MKTALITLLLLILTQTSLATKTINKITPDDFNGSQGHVILNGKLFFVDNEGFMWISEGTSETTKPLLYNAQKVKSHFRNALLKFDDSIFFINLSDELSLWKTDGIDFEKISDLPFNFYAGVFLSGNNIVGIADINSKIVLFDGQTISEIDSSNLTEPRIDTLCLLDDGEFTILARDAELNFGKLFYYANGSFSEIASDVINDTNVSGLPTLALRHDNACYYKYSEVSEEQFPIPKYLQVSQNASTAVIESDDGINAWKETFVFDDNLYFVRNELAFIDDTSEFDGRQIFQLNTGSSAPVRLDSLDLPGSVNVVISSDNYLYFSLNQVFPPGIVVSPHPPPVINIFDRSFNSIANDSPYRPISFVRSKGSEDILFINRIVDEISFIDQDVMTRSLVLASASINGVFSDDLMTYATGTDRNTGNKPAIYKISDQTIISDQLNGLWTSPDWQSQGLSLHTGQRANGSVYLFASFYFYKDGEPFWVAGNADYVLGSADISFDLFEFKGSSFLPNDLNTAFETISFGEITITPAGCDNLDVLININNSDNVSLSLNRVANTINNNLCIP